MSFDSTTHLVVIAMGVSGSGKTTVGRALAERLRWTFLDADDFHSAANIAKMRQSIPLNDSDRKPWVDALVARLNTEPQAGVVLACSALTEAIRQRFRTETRAPVVFAYLALDRAEAEARVNQRQGHFAKAGLIASQFDTLQEPTDAIVVRAQGTPDELVTHILEQLSIRYPSHVD